MNQLPTGPQLTAWATGTIAVLAATMGAAEAAEAPTGLVAATVGALAFGSAAVGAAVHGARREAAPPT
ncbi:hypothetical protein ACN2WE_05180 [Streptomyces sp. cg28]|uniref:hypothetical protein n=1 Tax=Streptomyces sp. cg28 TaxID=3403457 RepID=UPI003B220415